MAGASGLSEPGYNGSRWRVGSRLEGAIRGRAIKAIAGLSLYLFFQGNAVVKPPKNIPKP